MGFLDAAEQVLKQEGQPLHYDEITRRALAQALITTRDQTPARTLNAQLTISIQRGQSPFERVARGMYGLAAWSHQEQQLDTDTVATTAYGRRNNVRPNILRWAARRKSFGLISSWVACCKPPRRDFCPS